MISPPLILASTSFWRNELFSWLQVPFETVAPQFDEVAIPFKQFNSPQEYVKFLSAGKALSIIDKFQDAVIVGADTIVFFEDKVYGKPDGINGARQMISMFRGKSHQVFTGVCISSKQHTESVVVESCVQVDAITDLELEQYLKTSESLNKAGSYSITGHAKKFVHLQRGSLTNVLGLPLNEVAELLEQFSVKIPVKISSVIQQHLHVMS